jgi:hypothetical protein
MAIALAAACATDDGSTPGNASLGIARFETTESPSQITVRGFDADNHEIANMTLVHGRFALTGMFREDYDTPEVIGRKLDIAYRDHQYEWETEGFTPVLKLPAHPASEWAIAALVEDPHIKPILERWQIGWRSTTAVGAGESAFDDSGVWFGGDGKECEGGSQNCGYTPKGLINLCGGDNNANHARKVTFDNPSGGWEVGVAMCCPGGSSSGMSSAWSGSKTCPESGTNSDCGSSSAVCKGCGAYYAPYGCNVWGGGDYVAWAWRDQCVGYGDGCGASSECCTNYCDPNTLTCQ